MEKTVVPIVALTLLIMANCAWTKQCSRLVTAQMRDNARQNAAQYDWAERQLDRAVASAEPYIEMSDEELWKLIPSQKLPRGIHTNYIVGCPNCGNDIVPYGNYPWICDFRDRMWKIKCPSCGEVYPKNDFGAFYESALDEHGFFDPDLGDDALLFNAEHPDPDDPLHDVYVDDGYGMKDEEGNTHFAIAYFTQWGLWRNLYRVMDSLARAYTLTSDSIYAHKCAVMLDRVADVYPDMSIQPFAELGMDHSGSPQGKIEGRIWECNVGRRMATFYDHIYDGIQDDQELVDFCSRMAQEHDLGQKNSINLICRHIEDDLLLEVLKATREGQIWGNTGHHQMCVATTAIALDRDETTTKWLDWLFDPMYPGEFIDKHDNWKHDPLPWVLTEGLDRDGMGGECGNYGLIWTGYMRRIAPLLSEYPEYTGHDLVREYPKLKQAFLVESKLNCLDAAMPNIGDRGACGRWGHRADPEVFAEAFELYGDPRFAELAYRYAEGDVQDFGRSIYSQDPDELSRRIAAVGEAETAPLKCHHMGRYGQAILQTENRDDGRALWIHYGQGKGHSHKDNLNIGLYAKNIDMLPDLGYPEYTGSWPKRMGWTSHTISHNTLMIGDTPSEYSPGGQITMFVDRPPLRLIEVNSPNAYGDNVPEVKLYRRTTAMIDISPTDSYLFDVFRAKGGENHRISFHGPGIETETAGLSLKAQKKGTFAGEDVEFGEFYDGKRGTWRYKGSGFMYLYDVQRSKGAVDHPFTVDWVAEDRRGRIARGHEPHLRLHALTDSDEVALASGDPPQNKGGAPRRLRYLIQSRLGQNMESQFVNVIEPYDHQPFIRAVESLDVQHEAASGSVAAAVVELVDGRRDILISCERPTRLAGANGLRMNGQFGMIRLKDGRVQTMRMAGGTLLAYDGVELTAKQGAYEGTVTSVDVSDPADNRVELDPPLPQDVDLTGETIHFINDTARDTTYDIVEVTAKSISTGEMTIVAGFKDKSDFDSGFSYIVNPGDTYRVPTIVGLDREAAAGSH